MPFSLGYVPLGHKLLPFAIFGETWHTKQRYEHITMIEKINIIILVMQSCCVSHVLKRSYQADFDQFVTEIYKDDFSAFRLSTQIRLLPEFVKV